MNDVAVTAAANEAEAKSVEVRLEESWRAHVVQARSFSGTDAEYCRRNGLDPGIFRTYKKKYTIPKQSGAKAFVKVTTTEDPAPPREAASRRPERTSESRLPDARWTAEFIAALMSALAARRPDGSGGP